MINSPLFRRDARRCLPILAIFALLAGCGDETEELFVRLVVAEFEPEAATLIVGSTTTLSLRVTADDDGLESDFGRLGIRVKLDPHDLLPDGITAVPLDEESRDDEGYYYYDCDEPAEAAGQSVVVVPVRFTVDAAFAPTELALLAYVDIEPISSGDPSPDSTTDEMPITVVPGGFGTNLLSNPGFDVAVTTGGLPTRPGFWQGDVCQVVAAQNGIAPRGEPSMLRFGDTGTGPSPTLVSCQQWQIVDLGPYAAEIAAGHVRATASIWCNRVTGDETTDRRFDLRLIAFGGSPTTIAADYAASAWLDLGSTTLSSAGAQWQPLDVALTLPPTTSYVLVEVYAYEDVLNDATAPEFAGHYADDAVLMVNLMEERF